MVHSIYFCEIQISQKHLKVTANFYTYGKPVDAAIQHCTRHSTHGCQEMSSTSMPKDLPSAFWWQSFCANKNVFSVPLFSLSKSKVLIHPSNTKSETDVANQIPMTNDQRPKISSEGKSCAGQMVPTQLFLNPCLVVPQLQSQTKFMLTCLLNKKYSIFESLFYNHLHSGLYDMTREM